MAEQDKKRLRRRVLILALLLILLALPIGTLVFGFGHGRGGNHHASAGGGAAASTAPLSGEGGARLALMAVDPGAHPGRKHWHAGADSGEGDFDFDGGGPGTLQDLVLLTHGDESRDDNAPQSDGGDGFSFGGGGKGGGAGGGGGGFGGGEPIGFLPFKGPNDPSTNNFPDGPPGPKPGDPPVFSPAPLSIAAVPEPATWALFILGFGLTGFALRRAREARLAPALTRTRPKRLG
jgi:hypothetical protein